MSSGLFRSLVRRRQQGRTICNGLLRSDTVAFSRAWTTTCFSTLPDDENKKKSTGQSCQQASSTSPSSPPPSIVPGLTLSVATAVGGFTSASMISSALAIPLSGIPLSILLGVAIKNSVGYTEDTYKPGITYATKTILQTGIVCVAAKLSMGELLLTSSSSIPVVLSAVGAGMVFVPFAGRVAGLPTPMTLLLTAGTSICGVTAITALAPAIQAPNRDIAVAVANTVVFGTVGMLTYPYLFHWLCDGNSQQVGMSLGVAIHDTSQVLGSALSYKETYQDEVAFQAAAVTKLLRNLGLAVAIPYLSYSYAASEEAKDETNTNISQVANGEKVETLSGLMTFTKKYVPPFLMAFLGMSVIRSSGDLALVETAAHMIFTPVMDFIGNDLSKYLLGTAMAGVGLSTNANSLRGVGWKPFAVVRVCSHSFSLEKDQNYLSHRGWLGLFLLIIRSLGGLWCFGRGRDGAYCS